MAKKTLKCIEMSLDDTYKDGYQSRLRCAHCNNEYIAVEMSNAETIMNTFCGAILEFGIILRLTVCS
jgi:hypothetical protein